MEVNKIIAAVLVAGIVFFLSWNNWNRSGT